MTEGVDRRKMCFALYVMSIQSQNQNRYKIPSRVFARIRERVIEARREAQTGKTSPNKGKPMPEAQKLKISLSLKGRVLGKRTEESIAKRRGRKRSPETRARIAAARQGSSSGPRSEETKQKMSDWQKGLPKPVFDCPHCRKSMSLLNLSRWHGEKCKLA